MQKGLIYFIVDIDMCPDQKKLPGLFQNWLSVIGCILSVVSFSTILVLFILDLKSQQVNPYLGIVTYMIAPTLFAVSLLLIPVGVLLERQRRRKGGHGAHFPVFDFNNPVHQRRAYIIIGLSTVFLIFLMVVTYRAYEFTESVTFCGQTCHQVMNPEYVAYQNSPHARVACVDCHVGSGVGSYVRSKLAGTQMVYSVIFNKYHRPVETPIKNLRPAQETCEKCHWPRQFFGAVEKDKQYFLSDEKNTPWTNHMLMLVGGGVPPYGQRGGIHWHMNLSNKIYYITTDKKRQVIPWVKVVHADGQEEIYVDKESKFTADKPPKGEMRRMDCMDCHNRPSHGFKVPFVAVNEAMAFGAIDKDLPFIKREAVKALEADYPSQGVAASSIKKSLEEFYMKKYPEIWRQKKDFIVKTVQSVVEIYQQNIFPDMKASWKEYPNNIGHMVFPGCFRCHDNKHQSAQGKVLSQNCTICHIIIKQGTPGAMEGSPDGVPFHHPDGDDDSWKQMNCVDCHSGS